jgi:hypothetical protein
MNSFHENMKQIKFVSIIRKKTAIASAFSSFPACLMGKTRYTLSIFHKKEGYFL